MKDQRCNFNGGMMPFASNLGMPTNMMMFPNFMNDNYSNLEKMLFNDLRIDIEEFNKLNVEKIEKLSNLYHSTNVLLLAKYMRRNKNE